MCLSLGDYIGAYVWGILKVNMASYHGLRSVLTVKSPQTPAEEGKHREITKTETNEGAIKK